MFFVISKLLAFLTTPFIWILIIFLFSIFSKDPKRKRKYFMATLIMLYAFSNSFLLDEAFRAWEVKGFNENSIKEPFDAGIVLGGTLSYDPTIERFQFQRQGDRIIQAIILYRKGKIKKILFSGGAGVLGEPENKEGPLVKNFLLEMGVPESDILIEGESNNTHTNAANTRTLIDKNFHNGKFLLITSSTHERRAVKCFEKEGVAVTPYSVDRFSGNRRFDFDHLIIPNAHTLFNWEFLTHEWVGYVSYKMAGYI